MALQIASNENALMGMMNYTRTTMDGEIGAIRDRCQTYLRWYSPPWNRDIHRHDAWEDDIDWNTETDHTRDNFPITRACVDIWTSLEASTPPTVRAEAEKIRPPTPTQDQDRAQADRAMYDVFRQVESDKADIRSARLRRYFRLDKFPLKHHTAVKRKNLYGFSWMKVIPDLEAQRPKSHVLRDPTTVYPLWSTRDPEELDAILEAYQESVALANARYGLDLPINEAGAVDFAKGEDDGRFRRINDRWYNPARTMLWIEKLWWVERRFDAPEDEPQTKVHLATRVLGKIVEHDSFPWKRVPFVYWENTDERDSYGFSDAAAVIDINDELNRRLSQNGDIIGMYAAPRFQRIGGLEGVVREMPAPFQMVSLSDTERIEQILARIDAYPAQAHFQLLFNEVLPRVTGLPPIVWGLIANAQTSGRALTASWKATETRLAPRLMRNEQSLDLYLEMILDYARAYDWNGARTIFAGLGDRPFDDFRWNFPPMEPRDYTEVTQDAIFRRDAHLTTTIRAMRDTGIEDAEDLLEEVLAENTIVELHPDVVQATLLAEQAQMQNDQMKAQLQQGPPQPQAAPQGAPGQGAPPGAAPPGGQVLPPGAQGANVAATGTPPIDTSVMLQNGKTSNRFIQQGQIGAPPQ
jgi:hypothetical protein